MLKGEEAAEARHRMSKLVEQLTDALHTGHLQVQHQHGDQLAAAQVQVCDSTAKMDHIFALDAQNQGARW